MSATNTQQVPDNFIDVLADPTCSKDDITSKEILKRFGGRVNGGHGILHDASIDSQTRPLARRVETDPDPRQTGWQDPNAQFAQPSNPSTPPQKWRTIGDEAQQSPYGSRSFDGPDSEQRREWRNSSQGRSNNSVGVGGTG